MPRIKATPIAKSRKPAKPADRPRIYTFFDDTDSRDILLRTKLVLHWQRAWQAAGFDPRVLYSAHVWKWMRDQQSDVTVRAGTEYVLAAATTCENVCLVQSRCFPGVGEWPNLANPISPLLSESEECLLGSAKAWRRAAEEVMRGEQPTTVDANLLPVTIYSGSVLEVLNKVPRL